MRAPTTSQEELVSSIVGALKPYRPKLEDTLKRVGKRRYTEKELFTEQEVRQAVHEQIKLLTSVTPKFLDRTSIRQTRDGANKIASTIQKLQQQIKKASPELRLRMKLLDDLPPQRLHAALEHLQEICAGAVKNQPTSDPRRQMCARLAIGLMIKFSAETPTAGRKGQLREIASLFFEAVTGVEDTDFQRACREALREYREALNYNSQAKIL